MIGNRIAGVATRRRGTLLASIGLLLLLAIGVGLWFTLFADGDSQGTAVAVVETPTQAPTASPEPTLTPTPVPPTPAQGPPLSEGQRMIIERIGVDAPVATYGLDANAYPIVPTGGDAPYVVAWYDFSSQPGSGSNAVYAGHVTWHGAAVFYNLDSLQAGDIIRLRDGRGAEAAYSVTSNQLMGSSDPATVQTMMPTPNDVITIITCGGSFYNTGDPTFGGEYSSRTVIRAELVSVTRV